MVDTHAHVPKAGKEQFAIRVKTLFKSKGKVKNNNDNAICALHSPFQLCCLYGSTGYCNYRCLLNCDNRPYVIFCAMFVVQT